jgi:hypothetical protein
MLPGAREKAAAYAQCAKLRETIAAQRAAVEAAETSAATAEARVMSAERALHAEKVRAVDIWVWAVAWHPCARMPTPNTSGRTRVCTCSCTLLSQEDLQHSSSSVSRDDGCM